MKKLIVFLGIVALVLGAAGVGKVYAAPYVIGTDITINDRTQSGAVGYPAFSYNSGVSPLKGEDQETEPGTINNQAWDSEAFQQKGPKLSIIGGYNWATKTEGEITGSLFLKSTAGAPAYGSGALPVGNDGTGDAKAVVANSPNWNYDYAITFDYDNSLYTLFKATTSAKVIMHGPTGPASSECANPWKIADGWDQVGGPHGFTYYAGLGDAAVGGYLGGSHNVIDGIDVSFLATGPGENPLTWLHITQECGNDNLMGQIPANSVPLPPSVLLLGSGLLGLVGLKLRRKQTNV